MVKHYQKINCVRREISEKVDESDAQAPRIKCLANTSYQSDDDLARFHYVTHASARVIK